MNAFTVTAPEASFSGESCGVAFKDGIGRVTDGTKEGRAAIEYFRRRGYTLTPDGADEEPADPEDGPSGSTEGGGDKPFDPSQHNADEVITYLDSLGADDSDAVAEFERVIAAERAGKNRKTITDKEAAA